MKVVQAFRFELAPNDRQRGALASHAGASRYAWNWGLGRCKEALEAKERLPSAPQLHREWNVWKRTGAPWWVEVSKCAPQEAFRDLHQAFKAFFASRKGQRAGPRVGFPRFKKKHRCRDSFRLTGAIHVGPRWVRLPRLKRLRLKERAHKLLTRLEDGRARILSATVSRQADRWFVSLTVEIERADPAPRAQLGDTIGVDLGITCFAVLSNGERLEAPRPLSRHLRQLRRLSRGHSRKQRGSRNKRRSARRLARLHARIANLRRDWLNQVTTRLSKSHGRIVVEDLAVANLVRNPRLARHVTDQGWSEFRRQLAYKTEWYGSELVVADRFFPSSKRCSGCGRDKQELPLGERVYRCDCGLELDRDLNAARNLAAYPAAVAVSEPETRNACGEGSAGPPARADETALREAGTVHTTASRRG